MDAAPDFVHEARFMGMVINPSFDALNALRNLSATASSFPAAFEASRAVCESTHFAAGRRGPAWPSAPSWALR